MQPVKEQIIEMIKALPDDATYDDIMAEIYFRQRVDKSLQQLMEGKVVSHEEVKERISKWVK
jgi:predicted transcriptional regulator